MGLCCAVGISEYKRQRTANLSKSGAQLEDLMSEFWRDCYHAAKITLDKTSSRLEEMIAENASLKDRVSELETGGGQEQ